MNGNHLKKLPNHIAIIMDGNGRWAKFHKMTRTQGHIAGVKRVEEIVDNACDLGIKVLTLFTFSTENWSRPESEVAMLMNTLVFVINRKIKKLKNKNIKFQIIGRIDRIPKSVLRTINKAITHTKGNTGLILNLAFNYGSRLEIVDAVRSISQDVKDGSLDVDAITEDTISQALYTKGLPDPDLLIRTSGELRISNFLLWQLSYAEFYFTDKLWPDFDKDEFNKALQDYQNRERRYGNLMASEN